MNPQIENTLHDVLLKRIAKSRMTDNQYADKQGIDRGALNTNSKSLKQSLD